MRAFLPGDRGSGPGFLDFMTLSEIRASDFFRSLERGGLEGHARRRAEISFDGACGSSALFYFPAMIFRTLLI